MKAMSTTPDEYWYRIASLVYDAVLPALISVIHNDKGNPSYTGLPRDNVALYNVLSTTHKKKLDGLKTKKLIPQQEYDQLLPRNGETDSSNFDVSLAYLVIRNLLGLKTKSGWDIKKLKKMNPIETSIAAYVIRGKGIRDFLIHNRPGFITPRVFEDIWKEGEDVINGLGYAACDLNALKVDIRSCSTLKKVQRKIKRIGLMMQTVEKNFGTTDNVVPPRENKDADIHQEIPAFQQDAGGSS